MAGPPVFRQWVKVHTPSSRAPTPAARGTLYCRVGATVSRKRAITSPQPQPIRCRANYQRPEAMTADALKKSARQLSVPVIHGADQSLVFHSSGTARPLTREYQAMATHDSDPTLRRLDDQIDWYDRRSITAQRRYKIFKAVQLVAAAALPVSAPFDVHAAVPSVIGALIIVVEGFQQLNQYQQNWISYRSTCESLRHEKYLHLARAGPYADVPNPTAVLADRIEGLISQEHAKWISAREKETTATSAAPEE
jgi:hypothetical protein